MRSFGSRTIWIKTARRDGYLKMRRGIRISWRRTRCAAAPRASAPPSPPAEREIPRAHLAHRRLHALPSPRRVLLGERPDGVLEGAARGRADERQPLRLRSPAARGGPPHALEQEDSLVGEATVLRERGRIRSRNRRRGLGENRGAACGVSAPRRAPDRRGFRSGRGRARSAARRPTGSWPPSRAGNRSGGRAGRRAASARPGSPAGEGASTGSRASRRRPAARPPEILRRGETEPAAGGSPSRNGRMRVNGAREAMASLRASSIGVASARRKTALTMTSENGEPPGGRVEYAGRDGIECVHLRPGAHGSRRALRRSVLHRRPLHRHLLPADLPLAARAARERAVLPIRE